MKVESEVEEIIAISDTEPQTRHISVALQEGLENGRGTLKSPRTDGNLIREIVEVETLERIAWEKEKFRLTEESAERSRGFDLENVKVLKLFELEETSRLKEKEIANHLKADLARQSMKAQLDLIHALSIQKASIEEINQRKKLIV